MGKLAKTRISPELRHKIRSLILDYVGDGNADCHNEDIVEDIIGHGLRMLTDVSDRGDAKVIQTAIRELRYAFRLFAPYAESRKVTIFGSSRTEPDQPEYRQAVEFANKIAEAGFMVITGAGTGIMQAGHEGAGQEQSFGANIRLPWEQAANPIIHQDEKLVTFKYFFTRKLTFLRHSDAIALFPGGFGTLDEGYEALTLMQTGKSRIMPLILIDRPGGTYWKSWDANVREQLLNSQMISPDDLYLYQITESPAQAAKWIVRFYRNYHSARFVRDLYVIRMKRAPTNAIIEALNEDFADIIDGTEIHSISATPEEKESDDVVDLPRLAFQFDRRHYGRLRQLIDAINTF